MKDNPRPGQNEHGEQYNALPTKYDNPERLDLGRTWGTDEHDRVLPAIPRNQKPLGGMTGGVGNDSLIENLAELLEPSETDPQRKAGDASPVESLPNGESALDCYERKFGNRGEGDLSRRTK